MSLSPSELNDAFRLLMVAKSLGTDILYDAKRFDSMFRWNRFADLDNKVLNFVRGVVEAKADSLV
jgi:hypothetical protein